MRRALLCSTTRKPLSRRKGYASPARRQKILWPAQSGKRPPKSERPVENAAASSVICAGLIRAEKAKKQRHSRSHAVADG